MATKPEFRAPSDQEHNSALPLGDNTLLHEQAVEQLANAPSVQALPGRFNSEDPANQQIALDEGLKRSETEKLYASVTSGRSVGEGDSKEEGEEKRRPEQSAKTKEASSKETVQEGNRDRAGKGPEPGLNAQIDQIVSSQPEAQASEALRSLIFDHYYPKGSAARESFVQELKNAGREEEAKALKERGVAPAFVIGTQGRNELEAGRTSSKDFASEDNPKDRITVFNTHNPDLIGLVTQKNIILLDTANGEHREISLVSGQIKSNPKDAKGAWSSNLINGELSLEEQAARFEKSDPAKASSLYQQAFRLSDQHAKNRGISEDSITSAEQHSHRGHLLSPVSEDKPIDATQAINEYQMAGNIYEKLNGPGHITTIGNKYDLLEASVRAHGATESNRHLFEELRQRRLKQDVSQEEIELFNRFQLRNLKQVGGLYPKN